LFNSTRVVVTVLSSPVSCSLCLFCSFTFNIRGTTTAQEHAVSCLTSIAKVGNHQRKKIEERGLIHSVLFVLKTGTKVAKERAANLVTILATERERAERMVEMGVVDMLQKQLGITGPGAIHLKKSVTSALEKIKDQQKKETKRDNHIDKQEEEKEEIDAMRENRRRTPLYKWGFKLTQPSTFQHYG